MSDYPREIDGKYDLEQINIQIAGEEAGASEFISSEVKGDPPATNRVTFRERADGTIPKPLKVIKQGDPKPSGTKLVWSGSMVVEGKKVEVAAYRTE